MQIKLIFTRKVVHHFDSEGFWDSEVAYVHNIKFYMLCSFKLKCAFVHVFLFRL